MEKSRFDIISRDEGGRLSVLRIAPAAESDGRRMSAFIHIRM